MAKMIQGIEEKIIVFTNAWNLLAEEAKFNNKTLPEFKALVEPSLLTRREIENLQLLLKAKEAERDLADVFSATVLELTINSVRGTDGYGSNCELYAAMGYVRKSDRKSGLTRRKKPDPLETKETPPDDDQDPV